MRADGYHLLDAEMVSVDLFDELTFTEGDGLQVEGAGEDVPTGRENLVRRALRAVDRSALVRLTKRIPAGAGLGGGSTDAAAVLRWAGCEDVELAASLGSDVPFCLRGGRARVRGVGDRVEQLPFEPRTFTLLIPPVHTSTPAVYQRWDELGSPTAPGPNDLEPAALAVSPALGQWRERLGDASGEQPVLAGSGSTWFVDGAFPGDDRIVVHTVPPV